MSLDTYYTTDIPGLYISAELEHIVNFTTISLSGSNESALVGSSTWPRWRLGRSTRRLCEDDGYCVPGPCIITSDLYQRLQIQETRRSDSRSDIDLRVVTVGLTQQHFDTACRRHDLVCGRRDGARESGRLSK